MKRTCDICSKLIDEPYYLTVITNVIKNDDSYVAGLSFTAKEKSDLCSDLISHLSCWTEILQAKNNTKNILKVENL